MNRSDTSEIKQALKDRIESLCQRLLPTGKREGRLWVSHNPITNDFHQTPELKIALDRDPGAWKDYRTGEKGDVLGLVQYLTGGDFRAAMDWSRDFLGLRSMTAEQRQDMKRRADDERRKAEARAEADRLKRMGRAEQVWNSGYQDGARSTAEAHARAYFAARGCPIDDIPNRDMQTFRFAAAQEYWKRAQFRHENGRRIKVQDGPKFPAVLSAMRMPTGQISAVHMTFLSPLGPQKLPVTGDETAKIMFGEARGAMIRISHGPEGEPPETATRAFPLILCEGVEDGLSLALAIPEARVWAAGSLGAMASAPVWLPCVGSIIVARDNDWEKKTAVKQFERVMEELSRAEKPLTEMTSHLGKDFNDLMKGEDDE